MSEFEIHPDELVTDASLLDCLYWDSVRDGQEVARTAFPDRPSTVVGNDLFNTLFHYNPSVKDGVRGKALSALMESSAWMQMHTNTMGDGDLAGSATVALRSHLQESPEGEKLMQDLNQAEQQKEALEALEEMSGTMNPNQLAKEKAKIEQAMAGTEAEINQAIGNRATVRAIRNAIKETAENVENAVQIAQGWGVGEGTAKEMIIDPDIARLMSGGKLKRIMALAGKMRAVISAERSKRPKAGPQKVSLELGDDLSRVVPTELAMLMDPETEMVFYRRLIEKGLVQTRRDEKPREGKGPFVVCIDESGSMMGTKEEWAKALALAMAQQAHAEHRAFGAVAFSSLSQHREIMKPTPVEFLKWANGFFDGGTNFDIPMEKAMDMLPNLPNADIIFITDGECEMGEHTLKLVRSQKEALNFKVIGIQIGAGDTAPLKAFSDVTFMVKAERGTAGLEAIIQEVK